MKLEIIKGSENYTCQVIKLPTMLPVKGLDNLVKVTVQGNDCLIGKDSNPNELYLFFPAESQISHEFLKANNLYRHSELNIDPSQKGFFEDNRRVKAIKFKGIISSGFVIPLNSSLHGEIIKIDKGFAIQDIGLKVGDEFNSINGIEICSKYIRKFSKEPGAPREKQEQKLDNKMAPEHMDTAQLMKNLHKMELDTNVIVTYKLHGTSARYYNTLVKRTLNWKEKVAKWFGVKVQETEYKYVSASRRVIKSIGFEELPDKQHYYSEDLWTKIGKHYFDGKLHVGEAVYCEIVGKDYTGKAIQSGYTYGFDKPEVFIYRISNINAKGLEIDLSYDQMKQRAEQLGIKVCPELWVGRLDQFVYSYFPYLLEDSNPEKLRTKEEIITTLFYDNLLEKPSIMDPSVVEEGFCIRIDKYPRPEILKIKSKKFLLHESSIKDKGEVDVEEEQIIES